MRLSEVCGCGASFDLQTGGFGESAMTDEKIEQLVEEWRRHHRHSPPVHSGVTVTAEAASWDPDVPVASRSLGGDDA